MEAKADISLEDGSSIDGSALEKSNMSAADEINLNSDDEEFKGGMNGAPKLERSRSELEDIFEDIPEPRETKTETPLLSAAPAATPIFEPDVTSPRPQVSTQTLSRDTSTI